MTIVSNPALPQRQESMELHTGDRMTREEFHRAYLKMPEGFKAELIGGMVFVASPLKLGHGTPHGSLSGIFFVYKVATPGVEFSDNTTVRLGEDAEPQPDLFMRILPEVGGQSRTSADDYVDGPPELIAEVALSSRSIDLHLKFDDFRHHGVLEYLVYCVTDKEIRWFDLRENKELPLDADRILRSRSFPGLWIDVDALVAKDDAKLLATLQIGIATPAHAEFVARLAAAKRT